MKIDLTEKTAEIYKKLPEKVKKIFTKQIEFLERDLRHPSLRAKKYNEANDVWQARINNDWRFYFVIKNATIILINIQKHPK